MFEGNNDPAAPGLFDKDIDTLKEIFTIEAKRTRNKLLWAAIVVAAFDFISLGRLGILSFDMALLVLIVPAVLVALAFFSMKEPLVAIVFALFLMLAIWGYNAIRYDISTLLSGWLPKSILIFLLLAGMQNAREAVRVRKELRQP